MQVFKVNNELMLDTFLTKTLLMPQNMLGNATLQLSTKILDINKSFKDNGVKHNDILNLMPKLKGGARESN